MDQHNKNKKPQRPNDKRNSNFRGIISLVCWALLLTSIISYASDYMGGNDRASTSVELEYGEFRGLVRSGQVERVDFDNDEAILIITPVDGYTHTTEEGVT